ncbi:MAG: ABC transporter permease [Algicola sp.]|nr:ABC transporter permease [Algicola sp.]
MNSLIEDIIFAWRSATKKKAISLLIIITFAMGIGANSAIFSVVYNVLLAPLPYADGDRLVRLQQHQPKAEREDMGSSVQSFFDYQEQSSALSDVMEYHSMQFTLYGYGDPVRVQTGVVSWNYFSILGIQPILGRVFAEGEDDIGAEPLIILSNGFWLEQLNGDQDVIGLSLEMNNKVHKVIGVLPPIPAFPDDNDIWVSAASCPFRVMDTVVNNRSMAMVKVYGKLKEGVSLEEGTKDVNNIAGQLAAQYPDAYPEDKGYSANLVSLKEEMVGDSANTFYLLLSIAGMVILIASANVANLNLARLASRSQELAIREALGADPRRIARQLLTESTLFSLVGGVLGLLMAYPSLDLLSDFASGYTSLSSEVGMDSSVLLFSLVLSLATGLLSGSAAIFNRRNINTSLKEGGDKVTATTAGKRLRESLLVVQFALSFVILTTSALVTVSLYRLNTQDAGFDADKVLVVALDLNFSNYRTRQKVRTFTDRLLEDVSAIASVDLASVSGTFPLQSDLVGPVSFETEAQALGSDDVRPKAVVSVASADYHKVLNIALQQGRLFNNRDDENSVKVVIINRTMAQNYFGGSNSIGKRISIDSGENWFTVVGVVADVRAAGLDKTAGDMFYVPFNQRTTSQVRLMLKTSIDPQQLKQQINDIVHKLDPQQAIASTKTMQEVREEWLESPRLVAILIGLFGALAFIITLAGVIGVVAYNVSLRVREIGIRMSVGATPDVIRNMLLTQGAKLTVIGLAIGLFSMTFITPTIAEFLYQTDPYDPIIYGVCSVILLIVSLMAMAAPAQQATKLNPSDALRSE